MEMTFENMVWFIIGAGLIFGMLSALKNEK